MILNENFFDDIEIKDDELNSESELYTDDSKDAKSLIKDMFSSYKQCLCFRFSTPFDENRCSQNFDVWNLFDKTNKWHFFRNQIKRVCNVFDVYDIKYSEPFFCTMFDWIDIRRKNFYGDLDIINIENNKVIVYADNIKLYKHLTVENELNVTMFIDLPVFNSAKSAYGFLYRMANSLRCMCNDDAVFVYHIDKNDQSQYLNNNNVKIYLNNSHIKTIIKPIILRWIKDDILYLLSPQYKYRQEFEKANTERELQDLIKNH